MERNFFDSEYDQSGTRFETYSLRDQIKIYLYGMQFVSPTVPVLARPIAQRGTEAIPILLTTVEENTNDQTIKDVLVVFSTMQEVGSYNVQRNAPLMKRLGNYVKNMQNIIFKGYAQASLDRIKFSKAFDDINE